jgi:hypothetical protein
MSLVDSVESMMMHGLANPKFTFTFQLDLLPFSIAEATNFYKRSIKICASQLSLSVTENASDSHSYSHKLKHSRHPAKQLLIKMLLFTMKAIPINSLFRTLIFPARTDI